MVERATLLGAWRHPASPTLPHGECVRRDRLPTKVESGRLGTDAAVYEGGRDYAADLIMDFAGGELRLAEFAELSVVKAPLNAALATRKLPSRSHSQSHLASGVQEILTIASTLKTPKDFESFLKNPGR
jgi:hypothetical protein